MNPPRTPREAKQQLLDELVDALREHKVDFKGETHQDLLTHFRDENVRVFTRVAKKNGLTIKQKT